MKLINVENDELLASMGPFLFEQVSGFPGHWIYKQIKTHNEYLLIVNKVTMEVVRAIRVDGNDKLEIQ